MPLRTAKNPSLDWLTRWPTTMYPTAFSPTPMDPVIRAPSPKRMVASTLQWRTPSTHCTWAPQWCLWTRIPMGVTMLLSSPRDPLRSTSAETTSRPTFPPWWHELLALDPMQMCSRPRREVSRICQSFLFLRQNAIKMRQMGPKCSKLVYFTSFSGPNRIVSQCRKCHLPFGSERSAISCQFPHKGGEIDSGRGETGELCCNSNSINNFDWHCNWNA